MNAFSRDETELAPQRVAELLDRGDIQLVDVREDYEWEAGRIDGARHIELERLSAQSGTIDRERPVVFQCRLGARSAMATAAFRAAGWEAYNLTGGLQAWVEAGLPLVPEKGRVAEH